jgi:hypothetical protein
MASMALDGSSENDEREKVRYPATTSRETDVEADQALV